MPTLDLTNLRGPIAAWRFVDGSTVGAIALGYWLHVTLPDWCTRVDVQNLDDADHLVVAIPGADGEKFGGELGDDGTFQLGLVVRASQTQSYAIAQQVQLRQVNAGWNEPCNQSLQAQHPFRHLSLGGTAGQNYQLLLQRFP